MVTQVPLMRIITFSTIAAIYPRAFLIGDRSTKLPLNLRAPVYPGNFAHEDTRSRTIGRLSNYVSIATEKHRVRRDRATTRKSSLSRILRNSKFSVKTSIGSRGISGTRECRRCRWIRALDTRALVSTGDDCR